MKENIFVTQQPLTPGGTARLSSSVTFPAGRTLTWGAQAVGRVEFPSGATLSASGTFNADGVTLAPRGASWGGVRVLGGTLTLDGSIVEGSSGSGIYASGSSSQVTIRGLSRIIGSGTYGIFAENGADIALSDGSRVEQSGSYGVRSRGAGTTITLDDAISFENDGDGVFSDIYGQVAFASTGISTVEGNGAGLRGETAGSLLTGTGGQRVLDNDALGSYAYDVYAMDAPYIDADDNYWGPTVFSSADLTVIDGGAFSGDVILIDPVLTTDPAGSARTAGARSSSQPAGKVVGPFVSTLGTNTVRGWVEAAEESVAGGDGARAVDAVDRAVGLVRTEGERRAAWAAAARLAIRLRGGSDREGYDAASWNRLETLATGALADPDASPWALRALALGATVSPEPGAAAEARGHLAALLALTQGKSKWALGASVGGAAPLSHEAFAHLITLRLARAEGDRRGTLAALGALAAADARQAAVESGGVSAAFPGADVAGVVSGARLAAGSLTASQRADASLGVGAEPAPALLLMVSPNPTAGAIRLSYAVSRASDMEIGVYDGLGRRVAGVADGVREAGPYSEPMDLGHLPPGVYLARLVARPTDETAPVVSVQRFAVVR